MTAPFSSNLLISILSAIRFLYSLIDITSYKREHKYFQRLSIVFRRFGGLFFGVLADYFQHRCTTLQLFQPFLGHFCNFSNFKTKKTVPTKMCTQARNCFLSFLLIQLLYPFIPLHPRSHRVLQSNHRVSQDV